MSFSFLLFVIFFSFDWSTRSNVSDRISFCSDGIMSDDDEVEVVVLLVVVVSLLLLPLNTSSRFCTNSFISRSNARDNRNVFQMCIRLKYRFNGDFIAVPTKSVRSRTVSTLRLPSLLPSYQSSPNPTDTMTSIVKSTALASILVDRPRSISTSHVASMRSHLSAMVPTMPFKKSGENPGLYMRRCADHSSPCIVTRLFVPISGNMISYVGLLTGWLCNTYLATFASPTEMNRPITGSSNMTTLDDNLYCQSRKSTS